MKQQYIFVFLKKKMKTKNNHYWHILLTVLLLFSFAGCHNLFDKEEEPEPEYLVSYDLIKSYLPLMVDAFFEEMVAQFPEMAQIRDRAKHGIVIYKMTYKTTFKGENVVASGLVAAPMGEGPYPVISYQNGTNTLHSNAPSVNPNDDLYMLLQSVAATGFVISIPDYLGFGASDDMFHPYLHAESTVQSVVDMLRAVKELAALRNFTLDDNLYLTGYSQGGWATMQVQKTIETQYSGEFYLKASAPCAGPYDLSYINEYILTQESYPMPYFVAYIYNSYLNLDENITPPEAVFASPYNTLVPNLFDGSKSGDELNDLLTTSTAALFTENYRSNYLTDDTFSPLLSAMETNSAVAWKTSVPTRMIHGTADDLVPYQVAVNMHSDFQDKGTTRVELIPLQGLDHRGGIIPAGLLAVEWFLELTE
jgi:pimeloyl-ACP methyl ester carboxylesterase